MTLVDLYTISKDESKRIDAVVWMIQNQGAIGDRRTLNSLRWLEFEDDKEATFFILKWS